MARIDGLSLRHLLQPLFPMGFVRVRFKFAGGFFELVGLRLLTHNNPRFSLMTVDKS